jgi:hypothetical protein
MEHLSVGARADLGSIYYDRTSQSPGLVLNFVSNREIHVAEVQRLFRYPQQLSFGVAGHGMSQLDALVDRLSALLPGTNLSWTDVQRDDLANLVTVHVLGDPAVAQARLQALVGPAPFRVLAAVGPNTTANVPNAESPSEHQAPPTVGGLEIDRTDPDPNYYTQCSSGFLAHSGSGASYMLTAGHCDVYMNKSTYAWTVGNTLSLGPMVRSRFQDNYSDDAGIISLSPLDQPRDEVWSDGGYNSQPAYPDTVNNWYVSRVGSFLDGDDITGAQVCDAGYSSLANKGGDFWGYLNSNDTTVNYPADNGYPSVTVPHARVATPYVNHGISGGSVYAEGDISTEPIHYTTPLQRYNDDSQFPVHALGIVSGMDGSGNLIYTHVRYAMSDLGITVVSG